MTPEMQAEPPERRTPMEVQECSFPLIGFGAVLKTTLGLLNYKRNQYSNSCIAQNTYTCTS